MKKRELKLSLVFFLGIFLIGIVSASYCCEKTVSGAFCQNVDSVSECAVGTSEITGEEYRNIPASCEATSYCKTGTCINQQEGTCMSNTAQIICDANHGYWSSSDKNSLPQCKAGCCVMGSNAAFVTQVTCNRLASLYGITTSFQSEVSDELTCLTTANAEDEGACVYTKDFTTTCERSTRGDCSEKEKNSELRNVTFHNGYLCSATNLSSGCGKTQITECDANNDVRFVDSCGNLANIYDSSKIIDENYWTYIQEPTCTSDKVGNKNAPNCGSCDYYSGSMCGEKETGVGAASPLYGDYLCKDLDCVNYGDDPDEEYYGGGEYPRHGESWCATVGAENSVGSSDYRLLCYNGEVTIEECDPLREEICVQAKSDYSDFTIGNCKVNLWQSCTAQNTSEKCEDVELRDCKWIDYREYHFNAAGGLQAGSDDIDITGACVPLYPPGFNRDQSDEVSGSESCQQANSACLVTYEKNPFRILSGDTDWECTDNCYCDGIEKGDVLSDNDGGVSWGNNLNTICSSLGDCGVKKNYIDIFGKKQDDVLKRERYEEE
jgi:hypothetical protein